MNIDSNSLHDFVPFCKTALIFTIFTRSLNKHLLFFSSELPEIAALMLIYERGQETRPQTASLDTVRIKNQKTQEELRRVTSISVKH